MTAEPQPSEEPDDRARGAAELRRAAREATEEWNAMTARLAESRKSRDAAVRAAIDHPDVRMSDVVRDTGLARVTIERIYSDPPYHRPRSRQSRRREDAQDELPADG